MLVLLELDHFRGHRKNLHVVLLAELTGDRSENTRTDRVELTVDENAGVLVEVNRGAVLAADRLTRADDDGRRDGALLDGARGRRFLDGNADDVAQVGVFLTLALDAEAHGALGARVVRYYEVGEFL